MNNQKIYEIPESLSAATSFKKNHGSAVYTLKKGQASSSSTESSRLVHKKSLEHPLKRKSLYLNNDISPFKKINSVLSPPQANPTSDYGTVEYPEIPPSLSSKDPQTSNSSFLSKQPQTFYNALPEPLNSFSDPWVNREVNIASCAVVDSELFEEDDFGVFNPHWEDMLTFRELKKKIAKKRTWSISHSLNINELSQNTLISTTSDRMSNPCYRFIYLGILPVLVVLSWVSVPLPAIKLDPDFESSPYKINFWAFLLFYYGVYNICALLLVTNMFRLYSLNWWPESMSAVSAIVTSWVGSMSLGAFFYEYHPQLLKQPLVWTGITLITLILPLIISFAQTRRHYSQLPNRPIAAVEQTLFLNSLEWRTPSSYLRFLWFCGIFSLWYLALVAGEYLAYTYVNTLPHKNIEGLKYVYTWIVIVNTLDVFAGWVISSKIHSWPLQYCYQIYFSLTYFIFYRNLFARLHSPEQYFYIQLGSSLWVVLFFPFRMSKTTWRILLYFDFAPETYEEYLKRTGFTFYIRNLAENTTMLAFLCWVSILHYGPNKVLYPYFQFSIDNSNNPGSDITSRITGIDDSFEVRYSYELTMKASMVVWCCELIVSRMVRLVSKYLYKMDIAEVNYLNMRRYPHMIPVIVLLVVHVLQNMLFALIKLEFY